MYHEYEPHPILKDSVKCTGKTPGEYAKRMRKFQEILKNRDVVFLQSDPGPMAENRPRWHESASQPVLNPVVSISGWEPAAGKLRRDFRRRTCP